MSESTMVTKSYTTEQIAQIRASATEKKDKYAKLTMKDLLSTSPSKIVQDLAKDIGVDTNGLVNIAKYIIKDGKKLIPSDADAYLKEPAGMNPGSGIKESTTLEEVFYRAIASGESIAAMVKKLSVVVKTQTDSVGNEAQAAAFQDVFAKNDALNGGNRYASDMTMLGWYTDTKVEGKVLEDAREKGYIEISRSTIKHIGSADTLEGVAAIFNKLVIDPGIEGGKPVRVKLEGVDNPDITDAAKAAIDPYKGKADPALVKPEAKDGVTDDGKASDAKSKEIAFDSTKVTADSELKDTKGAVVKITVADEKTFDGASPPVKLIRDKADLVLSTSDGTNTFRTTIKNQFKDATSNEPGDGAVKELVLTNGAKIPQEYLAFGADFKFNDGEVPVASDADKIITNPKGTTKAKFTGIADKAALKKLVDNKTTAPGLTAKQEGKDLKIIFYTSGSDNKVITIPYYFKDDKKPDVSDKAAKLLLNDGTEINKADLGLTV